MLVLFWFLHYSWSLTAFKAVANANVQWSCPFKRHIYKLPSKWLTRRTFNCLNSLLKRWQNRCVHRYGLSAKMAARTAAFEFCEKINGCECEGFSSTTAKDGWTGKFVSIPRKRRIPKSGLCHSSGWQTVCVYCVLLVGRKMKQGDFGWTTKWFSQTKTKRIFICKDMRGENIL